MALNAVFLMYHELRVPDRALCDDEAGYRRYVADETQFRAQMTLLQRDGARGLNISEALRGETGVVLTFDDGCASDWLTAAPILKKFGFGATFFVVAGWVGKRGFLDQTQLKQLAEAGFEIGSHGLTHAFLSDLGDADLKTEMEKSKTLLESWSGQKIRHFSCPGGRTDARVPQMARELGYQTVSTSQIGFNDSQTNVFALRRFPVLETTTLRGFERLCRGQISARERILNLGLQGAKKVLGNGIYARARGAALQRAGGKS